jgi:hydrogenase maturation protease
LRTINTLILGIGNSLLSDEGAGIHMLDHLRAAYPDSPGFTCLDGGTLSFTLAPWIEAAGRLIVVDAAELDAAPGTVQVFEGDALDRFAGKPRRSVHEVSLGDLLSIARLTGSLPEQRALVAIQPATLGWGTELSAPVARALPLAARDIMNLVQGWTLPVRQATVSPRALPA